MARLLDDLLDVSRIAQDKIELRVEPVDLREVLRDSIEAVQPRAEGAQVRISVELPGDVVPVMGDPARLRQIFTNLATNAVKYGRTGGNVWARLAVEDGEAVAQVRDDGVGIPRELLEDVFDMFVQSDDSLARSDGGMGLGLTLVQGLVEMHGGAVTAHSDGAGSGASFVVRLPVTDAPISEVRARPPPIELPSHRTVVVIEDQDDNRRMLTLLLERHGYNVVAASDGAEGLRAIEEHRPAIAIVDIGLPGQDGYEVAREARKRWGLSLRLLALTGYGSPADRQKARDVGFDDHLVKPVEPSALFEALAAPVEADSA
jgi:two-component system CheB/CheR fusion protein